MLKLLCLVLDAEKFLLSRLTRRTASWRSTWRATTRSSWRQWWASTSSSTVSRCTRSPRAPPATRTPSSSACTHGTTSTRRQSARWVYRLIVCSTTKKPHSRSGTPTPRVCSPWRPRTSWSWSRAPAATWPPPTPTPGWTGTPPSTRPPGSSPGSTTRH